MSETRGFKRDINMKVKDESRKGEKQRGVTEGITCQPAILCKAGTTTRLKVTMLLTGLPGSPNTNMRRLLQTHHQVRTELCDCPPHAAKCYVELMHNSSSGLEHEATMAKVHMYAHCMQGETSLQLTL